MAWGSKSGRSTPLPRAWRMIRANVLRRDGYMCQHPREDRDGQICAARATDVDHIGSDTDHSHANLISLCSYHHDIKTAAQGGSRARSNPKAGAPRKAHAGVVWLE